MNTNEFIKRVSRIIFLATTNNTDPTYTSDFRARTKAGNTYFFLSRKNANLDIYLFKDGNISLKLKHKNTEDILLDYYKHNKNDNFEELIKAIRKDFNLILSSFISRTTSWSMLINSMNNNSMEKISLFRSVPDWSYKFREIRKLTKHDYKNN